MGTELQAKYQKLAQEYAKLRSQVDVLKKAIRDERTTKSQLEESAREKTLSLRKYVQENESLEFRNQQLSKRVAMLQEDLSSPSRPRKKKGGDGMGVSDVHTQELAAKISENERLHMKLLELTQKSERTISSLESKISNLEREVATHNAGADQVNREHAALMEVVNNEKAMVEAKLAVQVSEVDNLRKTIQKLQSAENTHSIVVPVEKMSAAVSPHPRGRLFGGLDSSHSSLNVPAVDTKLQTEVVGALKGGLELFSTFTTQLSTFHSYLEQRCKTYPKDTTQGAQLSLISQKLCELLHESSSFTRPLLTALTDYCDHISQSPFSAASSSKLTDFSRHHQKFVSYLETLTPYLVLRLEEESAEMICGPQLTQTNECVSQCFSHVTNAFLNIHDYVSIICDGPSNGIPVVNVAHCLTKLQACLKSASKVISALSDHFSTKIAQEYSLPIASQKLNTTNECIVSSLNGISSTTQQLSGFLQSYGALFKSSLNQLSVSANKDTQSDQSVVVQALRARATGYMRKLCTDSPESVPYTLAVYNARSHSSSAERQTFLEQVTANQDKLSKLEQEKEQLILDFQLLKVKYEKEQRKVLALESAQATSKTSPSPSSSTTASTPASAAPNLDNMQTLSNSVGCLSATSAEETENDMDDMSMVRQHFVDRIAEISTQVQEVDSKAAYYYTECRGLHKQLAHSSSLRTNLAQELDTARDALQQLQDQLSTTSDNYEKQLSAMSDHLCEVNDKLLKQSDELEVLRKSGKSKRWTGKS